MLMKIKSVSKSTPKFFTEKSVAPQPKLFFNDPKHPGSKLNKTNLDSKKVLKGINARNKENAYFGVKGGDGEGMKQSSRERVERVNDEPFVDDALQREKRRSEIQQMSQRIRVIEESFVKVKQYLERKGKGKRGNKINEEGKINPVGKETMSSINSFVTQMKIPLQLHGHSSSQSNLLSIKEPIKASSRKYYVSTIVSAFNSRANTTFMQICKTHLTTSLQLLKLLKSSDKPIDMKPVRELKPALRNTIIFDLDETLIHCNDTTSMPYDVILELKFPGGETAKAGINVRPKAIETLKTLAKHFEIIVFTASHECYGSVVCDYLDPYGQYIAERYYRDSCYKSKEGYYIKDLRVIDRPLEKMLLIDNAAYSYAFQVENGVPIIPFYDCKTDQELKYLVQYLIPFADSQDMRVDHCHKMRVDEYSQFQSPVDLINQLFGDELSK